MTTWSIPAKTFLLGEYVALLGGPSVVLTTTPSFQLSTANREGLEGIHPQSPAGLFWDKQANNTQGLTWHDPYFGIGGLGASSAQFIGAYLATCSTPQLSELVTTFFNYAWGGQGLKPSGYDIIAQTQNLCVYLNNQQQQLETFEWVFKDIAFLLLHTGHKLATHTHLHNTPNLQGIQPLFPIVEQGHSAFLQQDSQKLISAVNQYQTALTHLQLMTAQTTALIQQLSADSHILAAKGCGALGADVILIIVAQQDLEQQKQRLVDEKWRVLATSLDLYQGPKLIENKL